MFLARRFQAPVAFWRYLVGLMPDSRRCPNGLPPIVLKLFACMALVGGLFTGTGCGATASQGAGKAAVTGLRVNHLPDPQAVAQPQPRLGWRLVSDALGVRQTAYQVLVARRPELLEPGKADVWDSGRVESSQAQWVVYGGPKLNDGQTVHWTVRVWADAGSRSTVSDFARSGAWTMAPGNVTTRLGNAKWIAAQDTPATFPSAPKLDKASWIWFTPATPSIPPASPGPGAEPGTGQGTEPEPGPGPGTEPVTRRVVAPRVRLGTRFLRKAFQVAKKDNLRSAYLLVGGNDQVTFFVNGTEVVSAVDNGPPGVG